MVLYKHTVNFTFNGGLKHPADLVDGETCSKKLKKKILLLTNKLMSDIKVSLAPIVLYLFFKSENAHHPSYCFPVLCAVGGGRNDCIVPVFGSDVCGMVQKQHSSSFGWSTGVSTEKESHHDR